METASVRPSANSKDRNGCAMPRKRGLKGDSANHTRRSSPTSYSSSIQRSSDVPAGAWRKSRMLLMRTTSPSVRTTGRRDCSGIQLRSWEASRRSTSPAMTPTVRSSAPASARRAWRGRRIIASRTPRSEVLRNRDLALARRGVDVGNGHAHDLRRERRSGTELGRPRHRLPAHVGGADGIVYARDLQDLDILIELGQDVSPDDVDEQLPELGRAQVGERLTQQLPALEAGSLVE